jgi:hypothetical protein
MAPARGRTPIERSPITVGLDPMVIHINFRVTAPKEGFLYRPVDEPHQEDWESVADTFGVNVDDLISFNFVTTNSDVVNWCLRLYVGREKVSPSGNNWMFSKRARPGIIYIPPLKDRTINFDPEDICVWTPQSRKAFLRTLDRIAQAIPGERGKRIKRLMQVVLNAGYPAWRDLWYYNDMVIEMYVDWKVDNSERRKSTEATQGAFPFDGQAVWHIQGRSEAGGVERAMGMWRIHPFKKIFDEFCDNQDDFDALTQRLLAIDEEMYRGWHEWTWCPLKLGWEAGMRFQLRCGISFNTFPSCLEIKRISIGRSGSEVGQRKPQKLMQLPVLAAYLSRRP